MFFCFFFFSSRRRHTRSLCDWSSDVCSSDLFSLQRKRCLQSNGSLPCRNFRSAGLLLSRRTDRGAAKLYFLDSGKAGRSEERRVGKECRSRWWPDHEKKKDKKQTNEKRR